ncbi:MAG: ABC transporter ATP-binding protein [Proteobacteria bacterium]|nr:ABC transporter ATP-binding protein [Pseudomonadota bacterium]
MSDLYRIEGLRVDLPLPGDLLSALLPIRRPRLTILDQIDLAIAPGETFGLVGESGSGKTTLARTMLGLAAPAAGRLVFRGADLTGRAAWAGLRRGSAMMFQDPVGSLSPRMRVGALVTEPLIIAGRPIADRAAEAQRLLARVGLPPGLAGRYPHELSGGQARRVCVARALALDPALIIADEPTAGLDVSIQGEILNLMADLGRDQGVGFLVITHNLAVIRHSADRIGILYLGRLVETGPAAQVFARPAHPYTASLIASEPNPDPRRRRADLAIRGEIPSLLRRPAGCPFHTRCPIAVAKCRSIDPGPRAVAPGRMVRCHLAEDIPQPRNPAEEHSR